MVNKGQVKKKKVNKAKRRMKWLSVILIILIVLVIHSVFNDWTQIFENRRLKGELTSQYDSLVLEEKKLESEVVKLQDPDYMARYAREKFGYTKDGELILRVEDKDKSSSSSDSTEENVTKEDN